MRNCDVEASIVKFRGRADGVEGDVGKRASVRLPFFELIYSTNDSARNDCTSLLMQARNAEQIEPNTKR